MNDSKAHTEEIISSLKTSAPQSIVPFTLSAPFVQKLDLSAVNPVVRQVDYQDTLAVTAMIDSLISEKNAKYGIGGYGEKRGWYSRGAQFTEVSADQTEIRSIHLGVDIWAPAGTAIFSPYDAVIHSLKNNALTGDYGPTIILTHILSGRTFYTLYGHLSESSLSGKSVGDRLRAGEQFAEIGDTSINGEWPPHLHFQIITDMLGKVGDYPGVAAESQKDYYLTLCPDPNLILRSELL